MSEDFQKVIKNIEQDAQIKEIEYHNKVRQTWRTAMRKRLIFIGLPLFALSIIIVVWIVMSLPGGYDKCYNNCLDSTRGVITMERQDDCQFYCHTIND